MMLLRFLIFVMTVLLSQAAVADASFTSRPDVKKFIDHMVHKYHFKPQELSTALNAVKIRPAVIRSIKAPAEQKPWYTYQMIFVTESRIREGADYWDKYHAALTRAERIYGVPASIIIATLAVETKYGKNTGNYRVIDALSNIAFGYSSRSRYFRNELEQFFLLCREQHLDPLKVMGSYAGAIGQPQFMPSSYRHYAVNFSGNKKIDLSNDEVDVIGSIANYYRQHGWMPAQPVAVRSSLIGVHLPTREKTKVIELQGYFGREYWLGYHNFDVIKRYNPSTLYAMAVYQLSYYISALREKTKDV